MLHLNLHRVLSLFLVVSPHVLLVAVAVILYKRRLHRRFPCFFTYVLFEVVKFVPLFALYLLQGVTGKRYAYAYCVTLLLSIALRFGVIEEISKDLFRESRLLKLAARRGLQFVTGLLVVAGILLAVYAPSDHSFRLIAGLWIVNRGVAMVQCGLLLSLLLFSSFLGLSWRPLTFGIALGLGTLTSIDLAVYALRAEFATMAAKEILNLLVTGTYLICVLIWIGYSLAPEAEPVTSLAILPHDEVETWNMELQHLLKD